MAMQCDNKSYGRPPSWLERTFLYTFGLSGLVILLHTSSLYMSSNGSQQFIILAPPRPYYGKPSRPTTARPAPMQLNIDMEEHEAVMEERVTRMRRVCSQAGGALSNKNKPYNNGTLMWDVEHKLLYCPLYKVASGTWTTNFLRLAKYNEDLPKWQRFSKLHGASENVARGMFPAPKSRKLQKKLLKESTKFLVVRHPFDRIISAFTGKIANPMAKPRWYRDLQKDIVKEYREDQSDKSPPTFAEYIHYLLDLTENIEKPQDWRVVDCVQAYYSVCAPCDVEYNMVLKLETHDEDTEFLIRKLGLTELMEPFTMWKHNSKGVNSIGDYDYYLYEEEWRNPRKMNKEQVRSQETSEDTLAAEKASDQERRQREKSEHKRALFSQLTREEVERLHLSYKADFEMFGYDIQEFLEYAS